MYALVDANAYYCSAEVVFRPEWRGKPLVVLSNNDGMIVAANRQAKELGIKKFKPFFEMKGLCDQHGVIALSSNYELYADLSAKMMQVIGRFAPEQHIYSIDESFLSFKNTHPAIPCLRSHALQLRRAVWKECRLPVCVGIGPTLTLSKIANHLAKLHSSTQGVCVLDEASSTLKTLKNIPVDEVWGIGKRLTRRLKFVGVNTALDLASYPIDTARREFNVEVERTIRELNGESCKTWDKVKADKQQIFSTRSAGQRIQSLVELQQALTKHAGIASLKARQQGSLCKVMVCFAANSPFDENPVSLRSLHRFAYPTADVTHISHVAFELAKELFQENIRYYKIGVGLIDLVDGKLEQPDLFNPNPNKPELMKAFDTINQRYGSDSIFVAAQGMNQKWSMRRDRLTPQYTTKWRDVPKIQCG